ncbi:MAG TPA: ParA family protein [Bellilinea sp.]|jgi:chromosome partitioning protein|nr:ParA family protein [Bellilinea sp.]
MPIVTLTNQKGGCAKTTSAINLSAGLAIIERNLNPDNPKKILLVDVDPQVQATKTVSGGVLSESAVQDTERVQLYDLLISDDPPPTVDTIEKALIPEIGGEKLDNLFYIYASHARTAESQEILATLDHRDYRLRDALDQVRGLFSWIIIDTPPGLGWLLTNALVAADYVVVPVETSAYGLDGLVQTELTLTRVKKRINRGLQILGILPTMTGYNSISNQVLDTIVHDYGDLVLPPIRHRADINGANAMGMDIFSFRMGRTSPEESKNPAVGEYYSFAREVYRRVQEIELERSAE